MIAIRARLPTLDFRWAMGVGVFFFAAALYSASLANGFVWDDHIYVVGNPLLESGAGLWELAKRTISPARGEILASSRPVFLATLIIDRSVFGPEAWGHHLSNTLIHAFNSVWVLVLGLAACSKPGRGGPGAALAAALLFAAHPMQSEAVNAVSFRPDLLAAFFTFAALACFLSARDSGPAAFKLRLAASAACFALGLLSKESAAAMPPLAAAAHSFFPVKLSSRRAFACAAVYGAVLVLFLAFWAPRFQYLGLGVQAFEAAAAGEAAAGTHAAPLAERFVFDPGPPPWADTFEQGWARAWTMAGVFGGYARWLLFPPRPVVDRAPEILSSPFDRAALAGLAALAGAAAAAVGLRGILPGAAFGAAWCLLALLPVSGLFPLYNPVAERYLYLATPGICWVLAASSSRVFSRWGWPGRVQVLAAAAWVLVWAAQTHARSLQWRDDLTLFTSVPAEARVSPRVFYNRANARWKAGQWEAALEDYRTALRSRPKYAEAWLNLGSLLRELGRIPEAERCYEKAVLYSTHNPLPAYYYARHLAATGREDRARKLFQRALELAPRFEPARLGLAGLP